MPGFIVTTDRAPMGGQIGDGRMHARREYYYNYMWEIQHLFEQRSFSSEDSLISLKDATLPTFTVNKESYNGASLEYKFAKNVTWDDIKVTWYDSRGLLKHLQKWRQMVWTPELGIRPPNLYKKESILHHFLPTGDALNSWTLINSWPSQIRHGDLTYTSSDIKIVEVTVTYDWAEERPAT
jgi:hypothetical protein